MKNKALETRIGDELMAFIDSRKTLNLSSLDETGYPYASYAPFACGDECFYVLLSDIAVHGRNLRNNPKAAVQIVEDESQAHTIFARIRVNYQIHAEAIAHDSGAEFNAGIDALRARHGDRIDNLARLTDFHLFKLIPLGGRYVKNFGRAYSIAGKTLTGKSIEHLRDGHKTRATTSL